MADKKRFFSFFGLLLVAGILIILAGVAPAFFKLFAVSILPVWPFLIMIVVGVFIASFAVVMLTPHPHEKNTQEDIAPNANIEETLPVKEDTQQPAPQPAEAQEYVRYQEAFPTVAEVKAATARGEVIYYADHLPLWFEKNGFKIFSYNMLGSDSANGFAVGDTVMVGEYEALDKNTQQPMIIARNQKTFNVVEKVCQKHQPDIVCLQEWYSPKQEGSTFKFKIGSKDNPTWIDIPPGYQFKGERLPFTSHNSNKKYFNDTVTLFSDRFLNQYDVELESDGATWKCTHKTNPNKIIKVFNGHILHQDDFGLTESKIKRQLTHSLSADQTTEVISFNVGDFNNRVAPVNDNTRQNLTECARPAICTKAKEQGSASGSGCYQATGTPDQPRFQQIKGRFINPATAELMEEYISPLDTTLMPPSQAEDVNRIEPVMCIDDYYEENPLINHQTIFEYETFLRTKLGMNAPVEPKLSPETLIGDIKSIVLLEFSEKIPEQKDAEKGVLYLQKNKQGRIDLGQWYEQDGLKKISNISSASETRSQEIIDLFKEKKTVDISTDSTTFFKVASLCGFFFQKQYKMIEEYDNSLKKLLFVRLGATINNDRCLVVALPKGHLDSKQDHSDSKKFYEHLQDALKTEKTILFQENNSWFQSNTPTLINYQICIPFDKVKQFHQAVENYFTPDLGSRFLMGLGIK